MESLTETVRESIEFDSGGVRLIGNLFQLASHDPAVPVPGVVVGGTWTSVKEQMADRYAERLAARGFVTLSFDFTGFGASGGEPRDVESPTQKIADFRAAADYLRARSEVDPHRIGMLGVCASAGYVVAAAVDNDVRALALVAPWLHDATIVRDVYGGEEGVQEKLRAGAQARARYDTTGVVDYVPMVSAEDPRAAIPFHVDFYENPARGAVPAWPNRFAVLAWPGWLQFDPIALAPQVEVPTLVVHSEDAAIPEGTHRFLDALRAESTSEWATGTQFDFYDQNTQVGLAVDRAAAHFARHLGR